MQKRGGGFFAVAGSKNMTVTQFPEASGTHWHGHPQTEKCVWHLAQVLRIPRSLALDPWVGSGETRVVATHHLFGERLGDDLLTMMRPSTPRHFLVVVTPPRAYARG